MFPGFSALYTAGKKEQYRNASDEKVKVDDMNEGKCSNLHPETKINSQNCCRFPALACRSN